MLSFLFYPKHSIKSYTKRNLRKSSITTMVILILSNVLDTIEPTFCSIIRTVHGRLLQLVGMCVCPELNTVEDCSER